MKSKAGIYVRTKHNGIGKIVEYINDPTHYFFKCYKLDRNYFNREEYITEQDVIGEPSHNPIDLLEVGDIIATNNLCGQITKIDKEHDRIWTTCYDGEYCSSNDIKGVLTREQFEQMAYKNEIETLKIENKELAEQLEEYKLQNVSLRADIMIKKMALPNELIKDKTFYDLYDMPTYEELLAQQKEFIKYLENDLKENYRDMGYRYNIFREILDKYEEIIGDIDDKR